MKVLIIYGSQPGWKISVETLLPHLQVLIPYMKIITDIATLQNYLKTEGMYFTNYILPLTEVHIEELHKHNIKAMMASAEIIKTFSDKILFAEYVEKYNLQTFAPKIYKSPEYSDNIVIVKPRWGGDSYGIYLAKMKDLLYPVYQNCVVQEYIDSNIEFAGYFVAQSGTIIRPSFAYTRIYPPGPYIKGQNDNTIQTKIPIDSFYIDTIEQFIRPSGYTGTFCVDFKLHKQDGRLIVLEINPRLGGSLTFPNNIQDFADIILKLTELHF